MPGAKQLPEIALYIQVQVSMLSSRRASFSGLTEWAINIASTQPGCVRPTVSHRRRRSPPDETGSRVKAGCCTALCKGREVPPRAGPGKKGYLARLSETAA